MATRRTFLGILVGFGLVITMSIAAVLAAATENGDRSSRPVTATPGAVDTPSVGDAQTTAPRVLSPDEQLDADLNMTRFMSRPDGPWTAMATGQQPDGQLARAHDPGYVRQLEQRQADIDRMLAAPPR